jgi:hypothetical protein
VDNWVGRLALPGRFCPVKIGGKGATNVAVLIVQDPYTLVTAANTDRCIPWNQSPQSTWLQVPRNRDALRATRSLPLLGARGVHGTHIHKQRIKRMCVRKRLLSMKEAVKRPLQYLGLPLDVAFYGCPWFPIRFSTRSYSRMLVFSRDPETTISFSVNVPFARLWNGLPPLAFTSGSFSSSCRTKKWI